MKIKTTDLPIANTIINKEFLDKAWNELCTVILSSFSICSTVSSHFIRFNFVSDFSFGGIPIINMFDQTEFQHYQF